MHFFKYVEKYVENDVYVYKSKFIHKTNFIKIEIALKHAIRNHFPRDFAKSPF